MNQDITKSIKLNFDNTLLNFLTELERIFPESPARTVKIQFQLGNVISQKPIITLFMENVQNYENQIMNKDESYFMKWDNQLIQSLKLKDYYYKLNKQNKDVIWQYIQTLYLLSHGYHKENSK